MNKKGPIIVIEDDKDDQMLLTAVFKELAVDNEVVFCNDGQEAFDYLQDPSVYPFLILSDVNMPKLGGFELKKMVHTNAGLSTKCIPYLFFTTAVNKKAVYDAYTMSAQGFFVKPHSYDELVETMRIMVEYWRRCYSPSKFCRRAASLCRRGSVNIFSPKNYSAKAIYPSRLNVLPLKRLYPPALHFSSDAPSAQTAHR